MTESDSKSGESSPDSPGTPDDPADGGAATSDATLDKPSRGIQVFSAPSDAPRVRWRTDLISAGFSAAVLFFLILVAGEGASFDTTTLEFVGGVPGWLRWLGQAVYVIGSWYALSLLVGVGVFARGRLELLRDMILAALLAMVIAAILTQFIDNRWPELELFDLHTTRDTFPAFVITTATAIQAAASPWFSAPMRKIGWTIILAAGAASALGAVTTVSDLIGGLLVGFIAAAIVRYVFGTSAGLPSTNRVRSGLADLGVQMDTLSYFATQPEGAIVLSGTSTDGKPLFVGALGRDSWSSRRWTRLWKEAWYQDDGAQYGSDRRQQIEHESLVLLLADQHGASVPELVTVGMSARDDALLVTSLGDHTLLDVAPEDVDDDMLDAMWELLDKLHQAGLSHGSIDAVHIWFDSTGAMELMGFSDAAIHPTVDQLHEDVAAMFVMTTLGVGADRAIAAARRAQGDDAVVAMLPMLQTGSLNPRLRTRVKQEKLKVSDLRKQTAAAIDVDLPQVEQLTRVSWMSVLMTVFIGFAAYTIIGGLAEVGWDTIFETLADARWGLVLIALILAQSTNFTDAVALAFVSPKPVPVGITTVEQFAIGFVNIAVPSAAGRVATNARYFQKFGINAVTSTTTGVITGFVGFVAQAILVIVTILAGQGSIDFSQLQGGGGAIRFLVMAIVVFLGVMIVVALVPPWRHWAWSKIEKPISQMGAAFATLKDPMVALKALGASIGTEVLYAAGLATCVLAMGGSIHLGEAIFINVTVSLFAGLMPIPGGVGVAEAGLTAGLTAVGVPTNVAVGAVLVYRLISYYLPPIWGWFSLNWLQKHDYL
jgi:uncharacterized protein (TIRG00374 family)